MRPKSFSRYSSQRIAGHCGPKAFSVAFSPSCSAVTELSSGGGGASSSAGARFCPVNSILQLKMGCRAAALLGFGTEGTEAVGF
jgi:hypothetical protein